MAERFNVSENRFEYLKQLMADAKAGKKKISAKQHRELLNLKAAYNGFSKDFDLQTTLRVISHLEDMKAGDAATSSDLIRLEILKDKILGHE